MKRLYFSTAFLLIACMSAMSQNALRGKEFHVMWDWKENGVEYAGPARMAFGDEMLSISLGENYYDSKSYNFRWTYSEMRDHEYSILKAKDQEWLIIPYEQKAILFLNNKYGWTAYASSRVFEEWVPDYSTITATSYLAENGIEYKPEKLAGSPSGLPWASRNGYGIGDRIDLTGQSRTRALLLLNGYVSFGKRYLYQQNSRVKKIRVTSLETKRSKEQILKDSIEFQKIEIADLFSDHSNKGETTIEVTVLDVYPGSKYKDLCLSLLVPDFTDR